MKYAALVTESYTVPDDQRSRDAPGHGYPEHTETTIRIVEFKNEKDMEQWVKGATSGFSKPSFRLIHYEELTYESSITVKVKLK